MSIKLKLKFIPIPWDGSHNACGIPALNRDAQLLAQERSRARVISRSVETLAQFANKFISFRTPWAERLGRDRGEQISITQTRVFLSLFSLSGGAWGASLGGCAGDVRPSNSVDAGEVTDQASSLLPRDYGCSV